MGLRATNFACLRHHDDQLVRLGMLAEAYFAPDPNTCLLKLRQLGELLAQLVATHVGAYVSREEAQFDLLRRLQQQGIVPREVFQLFDQVRRAGNAASHEVKGDHGGALSVLKMSWQLAVWFHRTFKDPTFKSGPFLPPAAPKDETEDLRKELDGLRQALDEFRSSHATTASERDALRTELRSAKDDQTFWEQMAAEAERARAELVSQLAAAQAASTALPPATVAALVAAANVASDKVELDEAETRRLIDDQLRRAGWTADTRELTYARGARPAKGQNLAIAEWPTASGPADYVLFAGLTPVAAVEAKRQNLDVSAALQQAKRYSRGVRLPGIAPAEGAPWGEHQLPFAFSTNGRPFLRQLATRSGTWFCDLRHPENLSRPLDAWYTPDGLLALLRTDPHRADASLRAQEPEFGFPIRHYQVAAIRAAEAAIAEGRRELLLAMATGTGKTKTCVALIYRLLHSQRFRRVLFLVDRSALGIQAANAFKDTRMASLRTFAEIFGIKEIDEQQAEGDTKVHIATVQGMVHRVLSPSAGETPPPVDQYDCIVVDECHRGYLLDRELSDTELGFRSFDDYVSKYRRVLDWFDAVKVGLTATPALHTTQIFGAPVFTYSYREAVVDGYLRDHEPPIQIRTDLSTDGIVWRVGEQVPVYRGGNDPIELYRTPDELRFEVEDFNRKVVTEAFNRVVCEHLAGELDPASRQKTLIFCATDTHADLVVHLLKQALQQRYGAVDDDAVLKITGAADKPLELIRRFKNERDPNVAVTVDLLTTGIDVPEICNLVFLRRVNSRILFDQMLGRATRLCDEIGKQSFRVFDAVRIYEALAHMTAMKPVVVNPSITFAQLARELAEVRDDAQRAAARDQFVVKLRHKQRHLTEGAAHAFEAKAGMPAAAFVDHLRRMPLQDVAAWFTQRPDLGEILDRSRPARSEPTFVSTHDDRLRSVTRGYGNAEKPGDYLEAFAAFLREHRDRIPALVTVLTRPRELTRKHLRDLALALDAAGFSEAGLTTAWRELTNQDVAARIVGFIRKAAVGDPLLPYEHRVDAALQRMLASRPWTKPQRDWLQKIARQTAANVVVDRAAIDDPDQLFQRDGGGFKRLDRIFDGQLQAVLDAFHDSVWNPAA